MINLYQIKKIWNFVIFILFYLFEVGKYEPENYLKLCHSHILLTEKIFQKVKNPEISIISPVYNREKYLLRFLRSIQNQNFQSLEIILVNDCSKDNSVQIIEKIQKEDERIILLKNKKNKGTFVCRNEGALISKGKYIIFADPDDILLYGILKKSFRTAEKGNYDVIRYNYFGRAYIIFSKRVKKIKQNPIYQPDLSFYLYYGSLGLGRFLQNDYFIWNKLIKRNVFIKSLNSINVYYHNKYMIDCEDGLINFILFRNAKSLYYLNNLGYYYISSITSVTNKKNTNLKKRLKSNFLYFRFLFQNTKNNYLDKKIADKIFLNIYFNIYKNKMKPFLKEIYKTDRIYQDVINMFLNSEFTSFKTKKVMNILNSTLKYV